MRTGRLIIATALYALVLGAFWVALRHSSSLSLVPAFGRAFACFALLLAPLWLFAFGAADSLLAISLWGRVSIACALALPYFVFAVGTPFLHWRAAIVVVAFPVLLATFLRVPRLPELVGVGHSCPTAEKISIWSDKNVRPTRPEMTWRDGAALAIILAAYLLQWFRIAWPNPSLALFPKLFLADVALYCFLIVRRVEGMGYSLIPSGSAVWVGFREWLFYFPFAILIGEITGFIHFHAVIPHLVTAATAVLVTFLLVALPEELFFRALLQNLLERRVGRNVALVIAAALFGLSHFNHGAAFNWKYVLLATIAGIFYGRAWRAKRQILASVITHTAVDVVWALWFR